MWKNLVERETSYGYVAARCMLDKLPGIRTQTNIQYLLLFHGNNDSRTRLNVTLDIHCLVYE
jgi:hypothetical protein